MKLPGADLISNFLALALLGAFEASWAPMVPFVKSGLNLDDSEFGRLLLCMGIGSLCALPIVGALVGRFGCRLIAYICLFFEGFCLVGISFVESFYGACSILIVFGASLIGIDVASNVNAVILESRYKKPLMSGFHGGYSLGTIVGAMLMTFLISGISRIVGDDRGDLTLKFASCILFSVLIAIAFWGCRKLNSDVSEFNKSESKAVNSDSGAKFVFPAAVVIVGALCFIMYSSEGALLSWGAVFATQNIGIAPESAGYFYLFFAIAMTSSRFVGNRVVRRFGRRNTVMAGALIVAIGFFLMALLPSVVSLMIGFAMIGIGAGNIVPQLVSYAGSVPGIRVQSAISLVNSLGYAGILIMPYVIGEVSKAFSLETSFAMLGVLCLAVSAVSFRILASGESAKA